MPNVDAILQMLAIRLSEPQQSIDDSIVNRDMMSSVVCRRHYIT